VNSLKI